MSQARWTPARGGRRCSAAALRGGSGGGRLRAPGTAGRTPQMTATIRETTRESALCTPLDQIRLLFSLKLYTLMESGRVWRTGTQRTPTTSSRCGFPGSRTTPITTRTCPWAPLPQPARPRRPCPWPRPSGQARTRQLRRRWRQRSCRPSSRPCNQVLCPRWRRPLPRLLKLRLRHRPWPRRVRRTPRPPLRRRWPPPPRPPSWTSACASRPRTTRARMMFQVH
mmetsp:Transcript_11853/g.19266  ORF Transcript_11853/g.19266 Transcript_11853/m.19266 type:complete len:224 (+) Transcript_11853:597-1268(+)